MRGAVKTLSRLSAARALIASAALFGFTAAHGAAFAGQRGHTNSDTGNSAPANVAYAVPRTAPLNGAEVALPQPLTPSDAALYKRIFAAQDKGDLSEAKRLTDRLDNLSLMGQLEAQLYLGQYYHSSVAELESWLVAFGGEPESLQIYQLLLQKLPRGAARPNPPSFASLPEPALVPSGAAPPPPPSPTISPALDQRISDLVGNNETNAALSLIARTPHLSVMQNAALQGAVARYLFGRGDNEQALRIASAASRATDGRVWRPGYIAGLAAWQLGKLDVAQTYFEQAARSSDASAEQRAAGAFWAARTALRLQNPQAYLTWLQMAATDRSGFYGMLAGRLLGQGVGSNDLQASLSEADVEAVQASPNGNLALGLLQVGQTRLAESAFAAMWPALQSNPALARATMDVAANAGLFDIALAIAHDVPQPGNEIAGASLPMPVLHPQGGFNLDPALIYALARTESGFNVNAVSPVGARGLMQLMPQTASYIARQNGISGNLADPATNLALGQGYLHYLGRQSGAGQNLIQVLASYNAGPVAAAGWAAHIHAKNDPLIFMESIPNAQTRRFVRQVMTDSWIYAEEMGLKPTSLDAIAEGRFPQLGAFGDMALADR